MLTMSQTTVAGPMGRPSTRGGLRFGCAAVVVMGSHVSGIIAAVKRWQRVTAGSAYHANAQKSFLIGRDLPIHAPPLCYSAMSFLTEPFSLLWRHRRLLIQTTRNDIRARYAGSVLGLAWLVFFPLMFLGVYAVVYLFVFKIRFGDM